MNESTKAGYRKLAANFYRTRLAGQTLSPKRIADTLVAAAPEYRPAYWRRLRNALAFDQSEKGFMDCADRINQAVNPVTKQGLPVKPKQRRVKAVAPVDELRLLDYLASTNDFTSASAIVIARTVGARPAEMASIRIANGVAYIQGAKKSHHGLRGLDRTLALPDEGLELLMAAVEAIQGVNIGAIQDRIAATGRRLWPQRKAWPSLYSWRHQLGSDLKASGLSRVEIAYVLGHQSTESVEQYGNRKTARPGAVLPRAPEGADFSQVRERHTAGPLASRAVHDSPGVDEEQELDWGWD